MEWLKIIRIACTNATRIMNLTWKKYKFQIDYRLFYVLIVFFISSFDLFIYIFLLIPYPMRVM